MVNGRVLVQPKEPELYQLMARKNMSRIAIQPDVITASNTSCMRSLTAQGFAGCVAAALAELPDLYAQNMGYDWDTKLSDSPTAAVLFYIDWMVLGYGYGSTSTSATLAVVAITVYCIVTTLYISYIIVTGHTSIAWNSPTELIMLALQSKDPGDLGHISVGLNSMETFRRSVGIRVHTSFVERTGETKEKLELVFEHNVDATSSGLTKIERNRAY